MKKTLIYWLRQQLGSGKTAVLVERIIHKILDENIDIDKLLVVTFTNAAASEMRERVLDAIYKKLDDEPDNQNLQRQITLLNKASICTIDSFCLEIVRNYFYELENVSPNFRIADTTEIEILKQEILEEIFEEKYEEQNEDFSKLINIYTSYRDDSPLKNLILKIYNYIQSTPFPRKWLNDKIEMFNLKDIQQDFSKTPWGEILLGDLEEELIDCLSILEKAEKDLLHDPELENFAQTIRSDIEMLQNLQHNIMNWDKAFEISLNLTFNTWPRKRIDSSIKENAKKARDNVKKKIGNKIEKILICDSKEANQDILDMYQNLLKLKEIIFEFEDKYSKAKREKNIVDFNDIEHFALNILLKQNEDGQIEKIQVAKMYQEKFEEIAIDEYQDSNEVQEYILSSVARENNRFMVGDVKQSIYKFRQAMPELFLEKYDTYKNMENQNSEDNLKIQLFKNFRSRKNVLEITNIIFENIMSSVLGDIDYNEEEYLNLGANYEDEKQDLRTEINIIDLKEYEEGNLEEDKKEESWIEEDKENSDEDNEIEEKIEDIELEAKFVAKRIKELIDSNFQVWDRKKESYRNIRYKDIVILLRSTKTVAPIYEQELLNLQMPVFSDSSQEYLDTIEIQTIMSLLKIIDNPMQDIPLVAVLRSPMFNFTDNELIQIRLSDKQDNFYLCMKKAKVDVDGNLREKIENFLQVLSKWRKEQEYLALDEFIWKIYQDTGYYNYVSLMPNGELRIENMKMLFERAKQYETASFKGLYNFINFIEKLKSNSGDMSAAKLIGENDDVIRIMSIHKSKGLEFPVVFLSSTGKQFNLMDLNQNLVLHQKLGIGVKYIDYEKQVQYDTLSKTAIKCKLLNETLSEEMRILYVALTRAKEKLIITGLVKDNEKEQLKLQEYLDIYDKISNKIPPILIKKQKNYLDWIRIVYQYEKDNNIKEKTKRNIDDLVAINIFKKKEIIKNLNKIETEETNIISELEKKSVNSQKQEEIKEIIEYKYPHILSTTMPTKTSVSEVKQLIADDNDIGKENVYQNRLYIDSRENKEKSDKELQNNYIKPKFLNNEETEKLNSAQKGTLVHLCLQKLNEKQSYNIDSIKNLIHELELKEIITKKEAEVINPYKILEFTKSNIWNDLKYAKKVFKEQPFYISMPAKEIYKLNVDENILVQGIIDLYYIDKDNNIVLVDYKTDYVEKGKEYELVQKYQKQLDLYKEALEKALNKKVKKVYIYSVYLGKEICI